MKIKLRRSSQLDLENIYQLHIRCFNNSADHWYRSNIQHYLDNGILVEIKETNTIIGILLQGNITPCNKKMDISIEDDCDIKSEDIFEPINEMGEKFNPYEEYYGIVMICIDPDYRGKGLAKKLIDKHFDDNKNIIICLNTRKSNINAYQLYKKMGYEHIALIKNKYFLPSEDSIFMIKKLKN
jgi:ribosomal protein S18 acetylase RimI-like enzyme